MWIKSNEYKALKSQIYSLQDILGVATGSTFSYNMMRKLVEEMITKLDLLNEKEYALKCNQQKENIDKIAWHYTIAKDACIGGYDWLFKDWIK